MQGVPEILSNCLKNNTQKDPQDSFKLNTSKTKQKGYPRFFQTTSKTKHICDPVNSFRQLQKPGTNDP